jgi:hypothetical protein
MFTKLSRRYADAGREHVVAGQRVRDGDPTAAR